MTTQVKIPQNTTISFKTDLKGNIIFVNDDLVKLSEFGRSELLGHSFKKIQHPETPGAVDSQIFKTLNSNEPWNGMLKNQTKSGNYFWANTTITPYYDAEGKTVGQMYVGRTASETQIKKGELFYLNPKSQQSGFILNPKKYSINLKLKPNSCLSLDLWRS